MLSAINRITFMLFLAIVQLSGCAKPEPGIKYKKNPRDVSIAYLKSLYRGYPVTIDEDITITGRIISTDVDGNFYKSLVIEDESGGIEIRVDRERMYGLGYGFGVTISVQCNTLVLGSYGGLLQLGWTPGNANYQVGLIPESAMGSHFKIVKPSEQYPPPLLMFRDLKPEHINRFVGFSRVQIIEQEIGLPWGNPEEYTTRHLIDENGDTLDVLLIPQIRFWNILIKPGSSYIEGVLSYFNGRYQLRFAYFFGDYLSGPRFDLPTDQPTTN